MHKRRADTQQSSGLAAGAAHPHVITHGGPKDWVMAETWHCNDQVSRPHPPVSGGGRAAGHEAIYLSGLGVVQGPWQGPCRGTAAWVMEQSRWWPEQNSLKSAVLMPQQSWPTDLAMMDADADAMVRG